ncbi:MAG: SixA phosphatase family protein [Acidimicrobiia bacterium]
MVDVVSTQRIYLVRHAKAGSRSRWVGSDRVRPLTEKGRAQADAIRDQLTGVGLTRIVSSPYTRCWETVVPLSAALGLEIEESMAVAEGTLLNESASVLDVGPDEVVAVCSHGDVIGDLLGHLERLGVDLGDGPRCEKGSTWVLDVRNGRVTTATYVPPPAE